MALAKAQILIEHTGDKFEVMFNPADYTLNKDNNYASQTIPGLSSPLLQFVNGNLRTLDMELFFDTYEQRRDVRDETQKVVSLLDIDSNLHAPPVLFISWASLQFRCVLARVSQKFVMFLDDGRPVRATLTVTFNEFIDADREVKQANLQTANFSKVHVVIEGERLTDIASKLYENPQMWRPIALANGIGDPRAIFTGQRLRVPPLPFFDLESGEVIG